MHIQGAKMQMQTHNSHAAALRNMSGIRNGLEGAKITLEGQDIAQAATLEISKAARNMAELMRGAGEAGGALKAAEDSLFDALDGKVQDARGTARKLAQMIAYDKDSDSPSGLEERIRDREEGLAIAEYIAKNFFDNPKEANEFMDTVNDLARESEMADRGYVKGEQGMYKMKMPDYGKKFAYEELGYTDDDWADLGKQKEALKIFKERSEAAYLEAHKGEDIDISSVSESTIQAEYYARDFYEYSKEFDEHDNDVLYKISEARKETKNTPIDELLAKHHLVLKEETLPDKLQDINFDGQKATFQRKVGYNVISLK